MTSDAQETSPVQKRFNLLRVSAFLLMLAALLATPAFWLLGSTTLALVTLSDMSAAILILLFVKTPKFLEPAGHVLCATFMTGQVVPLLLPNADGSTLIGVPLMLVGAFTLLGRKGGIIWTTITITTLATLITLRIIGITSQDVRLVYFVVSFVLVGGLAAVLYAYEGINIAYEKALNEQLQKNQLLSKQLAIEKDSVEQEVIARTRELREAQNRLLETDKMKTEFVTLTSHNLRTPLTIIRGNIELLGLPNLDNHKKSALLNDLSKSSQKLGELIEDLLTISTIEAGDGLVLEEIGVDKLLKPLALDAERLADATNNRLIKAIEPSQATIKANPTRLSSAITNILDNAFKFTHEGKITFATKTDDTNLIIAISDTGIGIDPSEIPKLFTKFHRATNTMQYNYDGEGVGLYLVKLIIEEHGGTISVMSTIGKGTTFTITIPLKP